MERDEELAGGVRSRLTNSTIWPAVIFAAILAAFFLIEVFTGWPSWMAVRWFFRMIRDIAVYGWTNRSFGLAVIILVLLGIGLVIGAAAASAPWIYTIF